MEKKRKIFFSDFSLSKIFFSKVVHLAKKMTLILRDFREKNFAWILQELSWIWLFQAGRFTGRPRNVFQSNRVTTRRVQSSPGDPKMCSKVTGWPLDVSKVPGRPQNVSQVHRATLKRVLKFIGQPPNVFRSYRATSNDVPSWSGKPQTCSKVTGRPPNVFWSYRATSKRVLKLPGDLKTWSEATGRPSHVF